MLKDHDKIRKLTIGHKVYSVKMDLIFNSKSPKLILYFQ